MSSVKRVIAIDPGTTESGVVFMQDGHVTESSTIENKDVSRAISELGRPFEVVIEMIASQGMAVGKETFETCVWIGRFMEVSERKGHEIGRLFRSDIKLHLCGTCRAKDPNVRQAIIDRYGGKEAAIGKKKTPGPLYGVSGHQWQALAVGLCWIDGVRSKGV